MSKYYCGICSLPIGVGETFVIETHGMVREDKDTNQYYTETKVFVCEGCQ